MMGLEHIGMDMRIISVVVPVAVYFLILGLLNTRSKPQILSGRTDFVLLMSALAPLVCMPVVHYASGSYIAIIVAAASTAGAMLLLAPRGSSWVIYNIRPDQADDAISGALEDLGIDHRFEHDRFHVGRTDLSVQVSPFPMLRNVSIRLCGKWDASVARGFEQQLHRQLRHVGAHNSQMATAMLLIATAMLAAPIAMMARQVPQIVRLLSDLAR